MMQAGFIKFKPFADFRREHLKPQQAANKEPGEIEAELEQVIATYEQRLGGEHHRDI